MLFVQLLSLQLYYENSEFHKEKKKGNDEPATENMGGPKDLPSGTMRNRYRESCEMHPINWSVRNPVAVV